MLICIDRDNDSSCQTHKQGAEAGSVIGSGIGTGGIESGNNDNHSRTSATVHINTNTNTSSSVVASAPVRVGDCALESFNQYDGLDKGDDDNDNDDDADDEMMIIERSEKEEEEGGSVVSSSVNLGSTLGLISHPYREQPSHDL